LPIVGGLPGAPPPSCMESIMSCCSRLALVPPGESAEGAVPEGGAGAPLVPPCCEDCVEFARDRPTWVGAGKALLPPMGICPLPEDGGGVC